MVDFEVVVDGGSKWWQFWKRRRFQFTGSVEVLIYQRQGGRFFGLNMEPLEVSGMVTSDDRTSLVVSFDGKSRLKRVLNGHAGPQRPNRGGDNG
jgi:hypothetical protein